MFEEFGNLGLTREQYRDLLLNYTIAMHIRRRASLAREEDISHLEELERHLLSFASGFEAEDLVERTEAGLFPANQLDELCHGILEESDNEEFWNRLTEELAWRDYIHDLPDFARSTAEQAGIDPPDSYYEKYEKEIEEFGTDRLIVNEELSEEKKSAE